MPLYESTFIVRQDVANQQVEALTASLGQLVQDQGGTVVKTEQWGLKSLAYRVKKNRKGHYVMLGLDAPPAAVAELERNLRINEDVLRYLTVRVEEIDPNPSAMMQAKQGRDERRRDDRYRDYEERYRPRAERPAEAAAEGTTAATQGGRE